MIIKLLHGWNNYQREEILDLPDDIGLDLIRLDIGKMYITGLPEFKLVSLDLANKESEHLWTSLNEKD
jgi:hypothetical protein